MPPLILTALLEEAAQQRFDRLRRAHFPAERNHLDAHVTLFHRLPGEQEVAIAGSVAAATERTVPDVHVASLRLLGGGVAFVLRSTGLAQLRARLAGEWDPWLSPQDRAKSDLHVTVQNKVDPATARALHAELMAGFVPYTVPVVGLGLWRYRGGPWEPVQRFPFQP